ncbi:MAG: hypothetical protein ACRDA4_08250 [Filifactoraceae bacterium]
MIKVIINETHTILEGQKKILDEKFGSKWEFEKIPAAGLNLDEQLELARVLEMRCEGVVFISPVPVLLAQCSYYGSKNQELGSCQFGVGVFHNDKREKKELSNGKIISVTAKEGWELIGISSIFLNDKLVLR